MVMIDPKDWHTLADPDPEWEEIVRTKFDGQQPDLGTFADIHALKEYSLQARTRVLAALGAAPEDVIEEDIRVPVRDGSSIAARIHKPARSPPQASPLYVMFHGGGFCLGGLESETQHSRMLVQELGVTVLNVDYRLAPEFQFPTAAHDAWDLTKWAAGNPEIIGVDLSRGFIVGGASAGANLVGSIVHLARDEDLTPGITGAHYMIPSLCRAEYIPEKYKSLHNSEKQNENAPILSVKAKTMFADSYAPQPEQRKDQLYSSLLWKTGHAGLPPSYFQVAGRDPLRDDGLLFEKILREEEKTETRLDVYPGQPHGFENMVPEMKASVKWRSDLVDGIRWLLEQVQH